MTFENDPSAIIPWVVQAMKNILEAAAKRPTVKRVVLVSSSSTTYDLHPDPKGREIDTSEFYPHQPIQLPLYTNNLKDSWNEAAVQAAWDENTPADLRKFAIYAASKTEAERAAWSWMESEIRPFELNTVLPSFVVRSTLHTDTSNGEANGKQVGRILHPEIFGSTMGHVRQLLKGDTHALTFPERKSLFH